MILLEQDLGLTTLFKDTIQATDLLEKFTLTH